MGKRDREAGHFGHHGNPECLIAVAIVAILAAIAIPALVGRTGARQQQCLINMVRVLDGIAEEDLVCPVSDAAYEISGSENAKVVSCPDPEKHLETEPKFGRSGESTSFRQTLPTPDLKPDTPMELSDGTLFYTTTLTDKRDRVVIEERSAFLVRFFIGPLVLLVALGILVGVPISIIREDGWGPGLGCGLPAGLLFGFLLGVLGRSAIRDEIIEIPKSGGKVLVRSAYFGGDPGEADTYANIRAVYALDNKTVKAFYQEEDGDVGVLDLFALGEEELGALRPVQRALFPGPE